MSDLSSQKKSNLRAVLNALLNEYDYMADQKKMDRWQEACHQVILYFGHKDTPPTKGE